MTLRRILHAFALGVMCLGLAGCVRVAPYQRTRLAHPTMTQSDPSGPGESHVRAVQEGAIGGSLEASGGCGCN